MMDIIIVGTGGLAKEIWGLLNDINRINYGITILGFVSESPGLDNFCGLPVLGDDEWLLQEKQLNLVIANGSPQIRKKIYEKFEFSSHKFPSFIHPQSTVFGRLRHGKGCTIMPGCVFQPDVTLGDFVHFNMGVTCGHDVTIGNFCVINHNAGISGNVNIEDGILVGAGATIIEHHQLGNGSTLGAGAVLTKDIPAGETWVGIPAKPIDRK